MTHFAFSSLFAADMVASAFDATIERDASHGRVSAMLADALASSFGLALPAAPVAAVKFINELLTLPKAPKLASGPGARAAAPAVAQALHALAAALAGGGRVSKLPALAALPTWADPVVMAAAAAAAAEKRKATMAAKVTAPAAVAAPAATAPAATAHDALAVHVNAIIAAARGGFLSAAQINQLRAALDTAPAAAATVPTKHKGGRVRAVTAPAVTAPAVTAPAVTAPAATI